MLLWSSPGSYGKTTLSLFLTAFFLQPQSLQQKYLSLLGRVPEPGIDDPTMSSSLLVGDVSLSDRDDTEKQLNWVIKQMLTYCSGQAMGMKARHIVFVQDFQVLCMILRIFRTIHAISSYFYAQVKVFILLFLSTSR